MNHTARSIAARLAGALAACLLITGCVSLGQKVPDQLLSLTPKQRAPAGEMGGGPVTSAIVVLDPDTDRRLDVLRVPVQIDGSSIAYVKDAVWVERPARQFRRLLAETIRAKSGKVVVEGADAEVVGKTVVSGRLIDMGYDARDQAVVVTYDAVVDDGTGKLRSRRFEARRPGIAAEVGPVGNAINEAANEIAGQVADWLAG